MKSVDFPEREGDFLPWTNPFIKEDEQLAEKAQKSPRTFEEAGERRRGFGPGSGLFDQIPVQQPFSHHPGNQVFHLLKGVLVADVVPSDELVDVSLQVLGGHGVIGSLVGSLDHRPEAFDAVGVGPIG